MKKSRIFWRTVFISSLIFGCLVILITGISVAFENIKASSEAKYINSIEINEDIIRILDFEFKI